MIFGAPCFFRFSVSLSTISDTYLLFQATTAYQVPGIVYQYLVPSGTWRPCFMRYTGTRAALPFPANTLVSYQYVSHLKVPQYFVVQYRGSLLPYRHTDRGLKLSIETQSLRSSLYESCI